MVKAAGHKEEKVFNGVPASPGITIGKIFMLSGDVARVEKRTLREEEIESEINKFNLAITKAKDEIEVLRQKAAESFGEESAQIFEAHQMMLEDVLIIDETIRRIRTDKTNADMAFLEIMETFETAIANFEDEHLRSRAVDLRDVKRRVISNIQGDLGIFLANLSEPAIILAKELTPSETINLERNKVLGFATDLGGRTSHAAIMARSLKVPSVVGLRTACQNLSSGDMVILDGLSGKILAHPKPETINYYKHRVQDFKKFGRKLERLKHLPTRTTDSRSIELAANIEFSNEAMNIAEVGGDGIGLYRTEYLYLTRPQLPTEEEQFVEYKTVIEQFPDKPVIIRTFDVGGDKMPRTITIPTEENPFLGLRAIRLYRNHNRVIIKTQLRAIIKASIYGKVRILFPMISCVSEMDYCQELVKEAKDELINEGVDFASDIPVGAMIEVPSAAVIADLIAERCDFLSIGTNDLIQYTLAVDRGNEHVAYLYTPYNPAILRLIGDIILKGHQKGVWVGMCGEMASDPIATMVLIGLGLDEFSVSLISLLLIKDIIRRVDFSECENLAHKAASFKTSQEVSDYLSGVYSKRFKDLII
jgi:phosphoenolpyruvate-protein phosphotransferase (PTS system enzyme I)